MFITAETVMDVHVLILTISSILSISSSEYNLIVLHTNDVHARFKEYNIRFTECTEQESLNKECYGGVARRVTQVREIKQVHPNNTILLDGGDQFQGTLWFSYYDGSAVAYFMEKVGYDVMTLGNHEFDNGVQGLLPFLRNISFPVVSCNIDTSKERDIQGLFNKSTVIEKAGRKIGIIGYTYSRTTEVSKPGKLIFNPEVRAIQAEVDKLTASGINIIIALGHSGFTTDLDIADKVKGVDIVVGGHSDSFLYTGEPPSTEIPSGRYPTVVHPSHDDTSSVLVVQSFTFGKYLGYLEVTFDDEGRVTHWNGNPILLDGAVNQDSETLADINTWNEPLITEYSRVIGYSYVFLDGSKTSCRLSECNLGNLIADAMLFEQVRFQGYLGWSEVAIALMNGGGLRSSIDYGNVTVGNVQSALPFANTNDIFDIEGRYIRETLERGVEEYEEGSGSFLQVSGLQVTYNIQNEPGSRVVEVLAKCTGCTIPVYEPLDDNRMYRVVCNSFMLGGSDGFKMLSSNKENYVTGNMDAATLQKYFEKFSPIMTGIEGRIRFIETDKTGETENPGGSSSILKSSTIMILTIIAIILMS